MNPFTHKEKNRLLERNLLACSYGLAKGTGLKIQHWYDASMAKRRKKTMTDQIRKAIDDCGQTRYRIAKETGINESQLAGFYNGTRGISLEALDRLGSYLGLRIVMDQKGKK